ncbi:16S rRNA (guanine966-N2)-methyltransferase [Thioclava dalianensis]|uniref:16S rRNA (guanine(966)-N(2))-methyltransferase RsmD n=1 Tax=Thioclava dalianensis TaxID=1185766 RepID=UPI00056EC685|nr:16S rRNA (guanine(966)-N(2))-methyltransferase RsmD [Thioclava dalianensis]SFM94777.1 16S rRNA (guanine966-N2)-methyltransferase [Thioclava dalianensis]
MRIIGGERRGLKLAEVGAGDAAAHLRPTTDRVRESIFNLLINGGHGNPVADARVLDLFAGTGALGLEALSRGAARVAFVDDGTAARALLRRNIEAMRAMGTTDVWRRDAIRMGPCRGAGYDLIFLDPPYGMGLGERAIASCLEGGWIAPGATIMWEENTPPLVPAPLVQLDQRRYGDTMVTLARMPE